MHVRENGPPDAPAIVFLHGLGTSGWMWQWQADGLADYRCLMPDLPGHGQSASEPWTSIDDTADKVARLIEQRTPLGRAHVVGLSLGGFVTTRLLLRAPQRVDHAIISGMTVVPFSFPRIARLMIHATAPLIKTPVAARIVSRLLRIPARYVQEWRTSARPMSRTTYVRALDEILPFGLPSGLDQVHIPTLVVAGGHELRQTVRSVGVLAGAMPKAQGRIAPRLGHAWNGEAPELFSQMVRSWINDEPLPAELLAVVR